MNRECDMSLPAKPRVTRRAKGDAEVSASPVLPDWGAFIRHRVAVKCATG
jgi:hypothetical protein